MKTLIEILPDIEMCPMYKTLVNNKFKEKNEDGYARKYEFLPEVIVRYITENIKFRMQFQDEIDINFVFGIDIVTQYPEHLPILMERLENLIPEPNRIVCIKKHIGYDEKIIGQEVYIGQRDILDNSPIVESGLLLEYLGIYKGSLVLVVYNKNRYQIGYTLVDV